MGQYKIGTVTVSGEGQVVLGNGTQFLSNVAVGNLFKKQSQGVFYEIASVDSDTQITLSSKYKGSGESGMGYVIVKDFTPTMSLPEISLGDKDWAYTVTRALRMIDSYLAGSMSAKGACRVATTGDLTATYSASAKTLTSNSNGTLTVDTKSMSIGERVLVKDQGTGTENGIYSLIDEGSGSTPWVLSREYDFDSTSDIISGVFCFVIEGGANDKTGWLLTTPNPIVLDSTNLTFEKFSSV